MKVYVSHYEGSFDLADLSRKSWLLQFKAENHWWVGAHFDEQQAYDGIEEILNLIEARVKWYLYSTDRADKLQQIALYRSMLPQLEITYAEQRAAECQRSAEYHSRRAREYVDRAMLIRQEQEDSESDRLANGAD